MFNLMNKRLNKKGFTLIELIVVIAIIAILAVILIPRFTGFTENANKKAAVSDARNILVTIQALEAEGKSAAADFTLAKIDTYAGTSFATKAGASLTAYTAGTGTFTYTVTLGGKTYSVTATNYVLADATLPAPTT